MDDEIFETDSLDEAKKLSQQGEHSEIYDNVKKQFVEIEYSKGGETNYTKKWRVVYITLQGRRGTKEITLGRMSDQQDVKNALRRMPDLNIREVTLIEEMAMGGKVKFEDKVKAIKASLLKKKKVSKKVQKDYGKTYNAKEAEQAAKRIAGAMRKKEMK